MGIIVIPPAQLAAGMATPYITPDMLVNAPTGVAWATIPVMNASPEQKAAELLRICRRATAWADSYCNQVLRATINTEELEGPDMRMVVRPNDIRVQLALFPVARIMGVDVASAGTFPRQWNSLDDGQWDLEYTSPGGPVGSNTPGAAGVGPASIVMPRQTVSWMRGRNNARVRVQYVNGWPHAGLSEVCHEGDVQIRVDDVTGWAGATGTIFDGANTEVIHCDAVIVEDDQPESGPGYLTLRTPIQYLHNPDVLVSSMPETMQWGCIQSGISQAMTRGSVATTVQNLPGTRQQASQFDAKKLTDVAKEYLAPYRRVI